MFDRPANRFVAEFVGNPPMNVLDVALDPERAGVVVAGSPVPLGDRYRACAAAGISHVGVRARDLELVPAGTPGTVSGSVYVVEPLGDEVFVEVLLGEARVSVRAPRGWTADPGSPIGVRMDPARACFFTPDGTTAVHRSSVHHPRTARSARKWKGFCHDRHSARQPSGRPAAGPRRRSGRSRHPAARRVRRRIRRIGGAASAAGGPSAAASGGGQLVIGAFEDGALTPFKQTILPMFEQATGTKVQFLTEPYDSFFAKAFQDGQSKAGQYDIYIMDDPWIPQYAAAGILEDLGAHGITADSDYAPAFAELGYWPPQKGPRVKGFENDQPALIALPTIGDLQTLTYRNDVFPAAPATWDDLVSTGEGGRRREQGQVRLRVPRGEGQPDRHVVLPRVPVVRRGPCSTTSGTPRSTRRRARRQRTSSWAR